MNDTMSIKGMIKPHGGTLVNRVVSDPPSGLANAAAVTLTERQICDLEMISIGAFSPLTGFIGQADYDAVCDSMHLANGTPWPIPITCAVDRSVADPININDTVALKNAAGKIVAAMTVSEKYPHDKEKQARTVYRTTDPAHPGVEVLMAEGDTCLAGEVSVMSPNADDEFLSHRQTPEQTRESFASRGWNTVVGFQTRNPIHRAHEYLTKCALEICDGLLIHPLIGQTKKGDIPADVRMACYQTLIDKYYNKDRVMLSVMPGAMRYAGPREAILHAVIRKNYGCSHFIVGRDHAGVGDYYGTYDAQTIFEEYKPGELGIVTLSFEHTSWCNKCEGMVSSKTCPHPGEDKVFLSGTKVRDMLAAGQRPPMEFSRPEVADILIASMKN
jgi:sulfate adenylyltransferase